MNEEQLDLAARLVGASYARQAGEAGTGQASRCSQLLEQGKMPQEGWRDREIEFLLAQLSQMDSNNFPGNCGVGEREARVYSSLVARRHYGLGHGVGRSGDLTEVQPKAAGSSIINRLTNSMLLDLLRRSGIERTKGCFLVPVATGLALALCLLSLKQTRPEAKYVIWSRIDQKSCFKSILTAGLEPVVVELTKRGDELVTDLVAVREEIHRLGPDNVLAIMTCTSCFAPRGPDDLPGVAQLCQEFNLPHLVNNAYGLQSSKCCHLINEAIRVGRLDLFVQSSDKNLMVPVGGAIVAGPDQRIVQAVASSYPGRASASPAIDVFITLLSMGVSGWKKLLTSRKELFVLLKDEMTELAAKHGLTLIESKTNTISLAMTLEQQGADATAVGSMLFTRGVSGTRVVTGKDSKIIGGVLFEGWGAHTANCNKAYLTAAAAIGATIDDVKLFVKRVDKVLCKLAEDGENKEVLSRKTKELMM